ncbi:MAG: hypothetical protein ACRDP9_30560 [Kribbellaceae bacterium]
MHRQVKNNRHAAVGFVWAFIAARSRGPPARDHYLARRELGRAWKLLLDKKPPKRRMGRRHWLCTILADIAAMLGETDRPSRCARGRGPTMLAGAKAGENCAAGSPARSSSGSHSRTRWSRCRYWR